MNTALLAGVAWWACASSTVVGQANTIARCGSFFGGGPWFGIAAYHHNTGWAIWSQTGSGCDGSAASASRVSAWHYASLASDWGRL